MLKRIYHFLMGYLWIELRGVSLERFFNMCKYHGIILWHISYSQDKAYAYITIKDFRKLKKVLIKSHTRVHTIKRTGLPFVIKWCLKRPFWPLGLVSFILILFFLKSLVWDIQFYGNNYYTSQVLIHYLNENGYHYGMKIDTINCNELETHLRVAYPDITWVSAELIGCRLVIHIKENNGIMPVSVNEPTPTDLISTDDGVITNMVMRQGTPVVMIGDNVKKGDILVSGIVPIHNDAGEIIDQIEVHADADITIETTLPYKNMINRVSEKRIITQQAHGVFLQIKGNNIQLQTPVFSKKPYQVITEVKQVKLFDNYYIPLYYGKYEKQFYVNQLDFYDDDSLYQLLADNVNIYLLNLAKKGFFIVENNVKIQLDDNKGEASGILLVRKPTGKSQTTDTSH